MQRLTLGALALALPLAATAAPESYVGDEIRLYVGFEAYPD